MWQLDLGNIAIFKGIQIHSMTDEQSFLLKEIAVKQDWQDRIPVGCVPPAC